MSGAPWLVLAFLALCVFITVIRTERFNGDGGVSQAIAGGKYAPPGWFPWFVVVRDNLGQRQGGVLVSPTEVWSVKPNWHTHLVISPTAKYVAQVGYRSPSNPGQSISVVSIKYSPADAFAIFTLERPVAAPPISISKALATKQETLWIVGAGANAANGYGNGALRYASARVAQTDLEAVGGAFHMDRTSPLGSSGSACLRDDGAPVVRNKNGSWELVGIVIATQAGCRRTVCLSPAYTLAVWKYLNIQLWTPNSGV